MERMCSFHRDRPSETRCKLCLKPICGECVRRSEEGAFCSEQCMDKYMRAASKLSAMEQQQDIEETVQAEPRKNTGLIGAGILFAIGLILFMVLGIPAIRSYDASMKAKDSLASGKDTGEFCGAVSRGDVKKMKEMLSVKPELIEGKYGDGKPVHWAVRYGRVDSIEFLISNRADINSRDIMGFTPIHLAVNLYCRNAAAIESQVDIKALLDQYFSVGRVLVEKGASLSEKDLNGCTPLHMAVDGKCEKLAEYLRSQGAK